jgi:hypothetical protein
MGSAELIVCDGDDVGFIDFYVSPRETGKNGRWGKDF